MNRVSSHVKKKCCHFLYLLVSREKSWRKKKLQKVSSKLQGPKVHRPRVSARVIPAKCCTLSKTTCCSDLQEGWRFSSKYWRYHRSGTPVDPSESADLQMFECPKRKKITYSPEKFFHHFDFCLYLLQPKTKITSVITKSTNQRFPSKIWTQTSYILRYACRFLPFGTSHLVDSASCQISRSPSISKLPVRQPTHDH